MRCRALTSALAVLLVAVLAACAPPPEPPAPIETAPAVDLAAEERTIRDYSIKWLAAEQDRDLLTVMSFMDANVTTIFDGKVVRGRPAVEADTEARWQAMGDARVEWATGSVVVSAAGDLAYEQGSWTLDPGGLANPDAETGEFVCIWRKADGDWKVVVDAGTMIKDDDA